MKRFLFWVGLAGLGWVVLRRLKESVRRQNALHEALSEFAIAHLMERDSLTREEAVAQLQQSVDVLSDYEWIVVNTRLQNYLAHCYSTGSP